MSKKNKRRKLAASQILDDVLALFDYGDFNSEELSAELSHFCEIKRCEIPSPGAIGIRLLQLGFVSVRRSVGGRKLRFYQPAAQFQQAA